MFFKVRELDSYPTGAQRRKILFMAVLASLICSYEGAIASVVPLLLKDLDMTLTTYGLISAGGLLFGGIAGLLGGRLSDKHGRVRILIPMMTLTAFLAFAMVFVSSVAELAVLRFVLAFVDGMAIATTAPLVRDFSPRMGRAQAMGFWTCGPVGANFISAGIAAFTLPLFNNAWQSQFIIIGCVSLCASIYIAMNIADLSPRLRAEIQQTEGNDRPVAARAAPQQNFLRSPVVWAHCIGIGFFLLFYMTMYVFGQTIMVQTFGKTVPEASLIMAVFWVFNMLTVVGMGYVSDKLQLRRIFAMGFTGLLCVVLVYFAYLMEQPQTPTWILMVSCAFIAFVMAGMYSPWMALYSENAEDINPAMQGTAWGLFNLVLKLVAMIVVLAGPMVVKANGGAWNTWVLMCIGGLVVFLLCSLLFKGPILPRKADALHPAAAI